jgi:hypothetical protein
MVVECEICEGLSPFVYPCPAKKSCKDQVSAGAARAGERCLPKKLGARVYIDSSATNAAAELEKLGRACVILAIAPSAKAMSSLPWLQEGVEGAARGGANVV